jgi:dTDP-4-dehydrorhamnose reductase
VILQLIERRASGVHHVTNSGNCSWFDFVRTAFAKAGLTDAVLTPATYASLGNPTKRPMYSALSNTTFADLGIEPMPAWHNALDEFLAARTIRLAASE